MYGCLLRLTKNSNFPVLKCCPLCWKEQDAQRHGIVWTTNNLLPVVDIGKYTQSDALKCKWLLYFIPIGKYTKYYVRLFLIQLIKLTSVQCFKA